MVLDLSVNLLAILVCAVLNMIIGSFWYSPLFGKQWMILSGIKKNRLDESKKAGMVKYYIAAFIMAFIMFFLLANFIKTFGVVGFFSGMSFGFFMWLAFIATSMIGIVLWEGKSIKLYLINSLYYLVVIALGSGLLAIWN